MCVCVCLCVRVCVCACMCMHVWGRGRSLLGHGMLVVCVPVKPLLIVFSHNVNHMLAEELDRSQAMAVVSISTPSLMTAIGPASSHNTTCRYRTLNNSLPKNERKVSHSTSLPMERYVSGRPLTEFLGGTSAADRGGTAGRLYM